MLKYRSLNNLIYDEIKTRIITNQYKPGMKIDIDQIAVELDVSRTPIVMALKDLNNNGYVTIVERSGTFVRKYSADEIEALFDFREALEMVVVRKAISKTDRDIMEQFISHFTKDIHQFENCSNEKDLLAYNENQFKFHSYLWGLCPAIITNELQNLVDLTKRICIRHLLFSIKQKYFREFVVKEIETHIELAKAMISEDIEAAQKFICKDIRQTKEDILLKFNEIEMLD